MMTEQLKTILYEYANTNGLGFPLTAEQALNAFSVWLTKTLPNNIQVVVQEVTSGDSRATLTGNGTPNSPYVYTLILNKSDLKGADGKDGVNGTNGKDGIGITDITTQGSRQIDGYTETEIDVELSDGSTPKTFTVLAKNGEPTDPFVLTSTVTGLVASGESQTIQININKGVGTPTVGQGIEVFTYISNDLYRFIGTITSINNQDGQTLLTIVTVAGSNMLINKSSIIHNQFTTNNVNIIFSNAPSLLSYDIQYSSLVQENGEIKIIRKNLEVMDNNFNVEVVNGSILCFTYSNLKGFTVEVDGNEPVYMLVNDKLIYGTVTEETIQSSATIIIFGIVNNTIITVNINE